MSDCNHPTCEGSCRREKKVKQRKPIRKVSKKQDVILRLYRALRISFLKARPNCEARVLGCGNVSTDVHHKRGRLRYLLDQDTWLPVCRSCHSWIEENPEEAKGKGFSESRLKK